MYSYEDTIRAVQLHIKLGERVRATTRQSGYPTKNALRRWHREHERRGDLAKRSHRIPNYSKAQQQLAVDHFLHHARCIAFTRKALGYPCRCALRSRIYEQHVGAASGAVAQMSGKYKTSVQGLTGQIVDSVPTIWVWLWAQQGLLWRFIDAGASRPSS